MDLLISRPYYFFFSNSFHILSAIHCPFSYLREPEENGSSKIEYSWSAVCEIDILCPSLVRGEIS